MRTDIHTHVFHPRIAGRAVEHLESYYHVHCQGVGTLDDLRLRAARAGVERCVVLCAATAPTQVIPINRLAVDVQEHTPGVLAFGTIHPGYADWERQLHWLREHHIQGVKLHPDFQGFWLDDPRLEPILECAAALKLVCLFHIGDAKEPRESLSCPYKLASILDKFPTLTVVAAH
ncbi:MAG: amidohydrolase family protein, partial [Ottowia sp.]|nr:amidohydrolase family protein [Ottowia sp.]